MSVANAVNDSGSELSQWFSTYGLITAERILEKYKIRLHHDELLNAIKNPNSVYYQLLQLPLKNVYNGIILQQARDYQIYGQKLLIDYLLSGETAKSEEAPGGQTRDNLESERQSLLVIGEAFQQEESAHNRIIAESQKSLIQQVGEWQKTLRIIAQKIANRFALEEQLIIQVVTILWEQKGKKNNLDNNAHYWSKIEAKLEQTLSSELRNSIIEQISPVFDFVNRMIDSLEPFNEQISQIGIRLRQYRTDFYELILRINELIQLLPGYHYDATKSRENKEAISFDDDIGSEV